MSDSTLSQLMYSIQSEGQGYKGKVTVSRRYGSVGIELSIVGACPFLPLGLLLALPTLGIYTRSRTTPALPDAVPVTRTLGPYPIYCMLPSLRLVCGIHVIIFFDDNAGCIALKHD
jgi:hypothetical protein